VLPGRPLTRHSVTRHAGTRHAGTRHARFGALIGAAALLALLGGALGAAVPSDSQAAAGAPAAAATPAAPGGVARPIVVLLVRHAEKASAGGADPALSELGKARASDLARLCARSRATALYSSTFARTRMTLEPLAAKLGLEVRARDPQEVSALAAELKQLAPGSVAVMAGHSNTVPALAQALGAELQGLSKGLLLEAEYDRLFVLSVDPAGVCPTGLVELAYGRE
jgi:phosphohistidine phosphatase SixA